MAELSSALWTETKETNTATTPDGLPDGTNSNLLPATLREHWAAEKRFWNRINPTQTTTGTTTAYVITYGQFTALRTTEFYSFKVHAANTGAATLNINATGAKPIVTATGLALTAGQIATGQAVTVAYNGTSFVMLTPTADSQSPSSAQTLSNKSLVDDSVSFVDGADNTKKFQFEAGNITTATTRTFTAPNASGTLVLDTATQTLTNKTLTSPTLTNPLVNSTITVTAPGNASIEIGRTDGTASTPFIDFHSGATSIDYDTRIVASGGTGTVGGGTLDVRAGSFSRNGNTIWDSANDGAASGLDADLLDGQHGSFYQNAGNLNAGTLPAARLAGGTYAVNQLTVGPGFPTSADGTVLLTFNNDRLWDVKQRGEDTSASLSFENLSGKLIGFSNDGTYVSPNIVLNPAASGGYIKVMGYELFHQGNDGAGSNLDADLLDGQQGTFYQNAGNLNAGTIADARLPARLGTAATAITDWNAVTTSGFYRSDISTTSNAPNTTSRWYGYVITYDANNGIQQVWDQGSGGLCYQREFYISGSIVFKAWEEVPNLNGTQTLTNKTLTSPTIAGGTLSGSIGGTPTYTDVQNIAIYNSLTAADYLTLKPTDFGVANHGLFFTKSNLPNVWNISVRDSVSSVNGALNINAGALTLNSAYVIDTVSTQNMANKTITASTITTPTLTVNDGSLTLQNSTDNTKKVVFSLGSIGASTTRTLTVPNVNGTLATTNNAQTFSAAQTFSSTTSFSGAATFTSKPTIQVATATTAADYLTLRPSDLATGKPALILQSAATANQWNIALNDGTNSNGTINIVSGSLTHNGANVYDTANIVGTVSQSAGVPTGAIIESGSNSNGSYTKYADGTLVCFISDATGQATNTAVGSLFQSAPTTATWPVPFVGTTIPFVTITPNNSARWGTATAATSSVTYRSYAAATSATTIAVYIQGTGRWF